MDQRKKVLLGVLATFIFGSAALGAGLVLRHQLSADVICPPSVGYGYGSSIFCVNTGYGYGSFRLLSVSPLTVRNGDMLTLTGSGFTNSTSIRFDGKDPLYSPITVGKHKGTSTTLHIVADSNLGIMTTAGVHTVAVHDARGDSNSLSFTVVAGPRLVQAADGSLQPTWVAGDAITLVLENAGDGVVLIDGNPSSTIHATYKPVGSISPNTSTVMFALPATLCSGTATSNCPALTAGAHTIAWKTNTGVTTNSLPFTVSVQAPQLLSVSPTTVKSGDTLTLKVNNHSAPTGTPVIDGTDVTTPPASFKYDTNGSTIIVTTTVPNLTAGNHTILFRNSGNVSSNSLSFTVAASAPITLPPTISAVLPTVSTSGKTVTVSGANFTSSSQVLLVQTGRDPVATLTAVVAAGGKSLTFTTPTISQDTCAVRIFVLCVGQRPPTGLAQGTYTVKVKTANGTSAGLPITLKP